MSDWITIFAEVPPITFNPVKTINDLFKAGASTALSLLITFCHDFKKYDMMWEESRDNFESKEFAAVLRRYKQMLTEQRTEFFDVADFEFIADQYIDKSQFSNALQACEIALRQHPNSIIVKVKKAQIFLSQLKLQKAIHLLKQLEEMEPSNPDVMMMLGTCHNLKGEHHQAY